MTDPFVHLPPRTGAATGRRLVHFRTMIAGIVVAGIGALLIGFGIGYTVADNGKDAACNRAMHALFSPRPVDEAQYQKDRAACFGR